MVHDWIQDMHDLFIEPGPIIRMNGYKLRSNLERGDAWLCSHCGEKEEEEMPISLFGPENKHIEWELTFHLHCIKRTGIWDLMKPKERKKYEF